MKLYLTECKRIAKSLIYFLFLVVLIIMWGRNMAGGTKDEIEAVSSNTREPSITMDRPLLKKPTANDENYGKQQKEIPEKLMCGGADKLIQEYNNNSYATYPFGYYKSVRLNDEQQQKVLKIIQEITGLSEDDIHDVPEGYFPSNNGSIIHYNADNFTKNEDGSYVIEAGDDKEEKATFESKVTYKRFKELMKQMEGMLGKGSSYSIESLITYFGIDDMSYEDAQVEYNATIKDDKITGAFARLFCDYMSLPLALFPIFLVVIYWMQDRRAKTHELIYGREIRSTRIVLARYLAGVTMTMLPVWILSLESLIPLMQYASKQGLSADPFAFAKYILVCLLPTVMVVWALGMFLTILTDSPLAILVQFGWWYLGNGTTSLVGSTKWYTLMIRHNSLRKVREWKSTLGTLAVNRGFYLCVTIALIAVSIVLYERKRRGRLDAGRFYQKFTHRAGRQS